MPTKELTLLCSICYEGLREEERGPCAKYLEQGCCIGGVPDEECEIKIEGEYQTCPFYPCKMCE